MQAKGTIIVQQKKAVGRMCVRGRGLLGSCAPAAKGAPAEEEGFDGGLRALSIQDGSLCLVIGPQADMHSFLCGGRLDAVRRQICSHALPLCPTRQEHDTPWKRAPCRWSPREDVFYLFWEA